MHKNVGKALFGLIICYIGHFILFCHTAVALFLTLKTPITNECLEASKKCSVDRDQTAPYIPLGTRCLLLHLN